MTNDFKKSFFRTVALFVTGLACVTGACMAEPLESIPHGMNEQVVMVPIGSGWGSVELETTLFIPPGTGPFPLVVINHGKAAGNPRFDPRARFVAASREFLKRGYLVAIPMRPGFSKSTGRDITPGCNTESYGALQGEALWSAIAELTKRTDVDPTRILVVGQSTGGLTSIAAATTAYPGVRGVLNFAGGVRNTSCNWEKALVDAFETYGAKAQIRSLWFYGDNDSFWGAELPKKMFEAYNAAGGKARMISYGKFYGGDAHGMFSSDIGAPIWWPETEKFLTEVGLPTVIQFAITKTPRPPKTDYAALNDVQKVPYLDASRRERYKQYLSLRYPKAFAIAPTGNVGWSSESFDPIASSLSACEAIAKEPCAVYAVNDDVVWPTNTSP